MSEKKKELQEYLAANVNNWVEPMVYDIAKKRPTDPISHALQWLTNYISTYLLIKPKRKIVPMIHNLMMKSKKFLSINQSFKKRNYKEKLEAEWEFQKKSLVISTESRAFN